MVWQKPFLPLYSSSEFIICSSDLDLRASYPCYTPVIIFFLLDVDTVLNMDQIPWARGAK